MTGRQAMQSRKGLINGVPYRKRNETRKSDGRKEIRKMAAAGVAGLSMIAVGLLLLLYFEL